MNQTNKLIFALVLLVIAGGLFFWQFKPSNTSQTEERQRIAMNTLQAKALESIFSKVGSKKWSDPSLWSSSKTASTYGAIAEKFFTATPSMDNVKILDYGTNKQNDDAPFLVLEVSTTDVCILVEFKETKDAQMVMNNILESQVKVKDYRK